MSWLSSFLNPGKGYQTYQNNLTKAYQDAQGLQQPYLNYGTQAGQQLTDATGKLLDPVALQNEWMNSYETSEQARRAMSDAKDAGLGAASSMGLMGSSAAIQGIENTAGGLQAADRANYLQDLMNKYQSGVNSATGMYNTGAQTAGQAAQQAMQYGDYMGTAGAGRDNAGGNMLSGLIGTGAGLFGSALGGPIGGAIGGWLGNKLGVEPGQWQPWQGSR